MREIAQDDPEDIDARAIVETLEAEEPIIDPGLEWIWRAWHRLTDDRPFYSGGMGPSVPGRIPWTTVRLWCRHYRLSAGEMAMLDRCFGAMDDVYLRWFRSKIKANEEMPST